MALLTRIPKIEILCLGMPRGMTGKAGRIDQNRDPLVIKVNRGDVKFESFVSIPFSFAFTNILLGRPK